MNNIENETIKQ